MPAGYNRRSEHDSADDVRRGQRRPVDAYEEEWDSENAAVGPRRHRRTEDDYEDEYRDSGDRRYKEHTVRQQVQMPPSSEEEERPRRRPLREEEDLRRRRSLSWDVDVEPLRERRSEHGYVHSPRRADSRRNRVKESSDSDTRQDRRHVKGTGDKELIVAQSADKDLKHALVCLMKTQRLASDLLVACKARTVKSERKAPAPLTVHVYHHHDGTTDSTTTPVQHRVSSPGNRNGSRVAIVNAKNGEAAPIDIVDDLRVAEGYITTGSARRPVAPSSPPRRASLGHSRAVGNRRPPVSYAAISATIARSPTTGATTAATARGKPG